MNERHFISYTSCPNEYIESVYAHISLTPEAAQQLLNLMKLVSKLKAEHPQCKNISCLKLWDYSPTWFKYPYFEAHNIEEGKDGEWFEIEGFEEPTYEESEPVECEQISVSGDDILYQCYLKHTSDRLETASLGKSELERIIQELPFYEESKEAASCQN